MALSCFERAFAVADDSNLADVWYNIGQVAVGKPFCCCSWCCMHLQLLFAKSLNTLCGLQSQPSIELQPDCVNCTVVKCWPTNLCS